MFIQLFSDKTVAVYGLLGAAGYLSGLITLLVACRVKKLSFDDTVFVYVWAGVLAMAGAKGLYLLLDIKNIVNAIGRGGEYLKTYLRALMSGGMVFYGGLGGSFLGVFLASRFFKLDFRTTVNTLVPALPLAHAFGRLGCHTIGCCYGIEVHGRFGKMYTDSVFAPNKVLLFPVQLTESICDLLIFLALTIIFYKTPKEKLKKCPITEIYLISYSVLRFSLEYLRGDAVRGHFLMFSTSQWISLIILISAVISLFHMARSAASRAA